MSFNFRQDQWSNDFTNIRYSSTGDSEASSPSVIKTAFWSYCGPLLTGTRLPSSFPAWASHALDGDILPLVLPFLQAAHEVLHSRGISHYWLTLRATGPTTEFDKPRWHTDNLFFSTDERNGSGRGTDWKICATLLGDSTIFIPAEHQSTARKMQRSAKKALRTNHPCIDVRCGGCAASAEAVRDRLAAALDEFGRIQAGKGEFSLFRTGHDSGAVHSEPKASQGGRIFCNIVPGTEGELRHLVSRWGMEFPRSWWV